MLPPDQMIEFDPSSTHTTATGSDFVHRKVGEKPGHRVSSEERKAPLRATEPPRRGHRGGATTRPRFRARASIRERSCRRPGCGRDRTGTRSGVLGNPSAGHDQLVRSRRIDRPRCAEGDLPSHGGTGQEVVPPVTGCDHLAVSPSRRLAGQHGPVQPVRGRWQCRWQFRGRRPRRGRRGRGRSWVGPVRSGRCGCVGGPGALRCVAFAPSGAGGQGGVAKAAATENRRCRAGAFPLASPWCSRPCQEWPCGRRRLGVPRAAGRTDVASFITSALPGGPRGRFHRLVSQVSGLGLTPPVTSGKTSVDG